MKSATYTLYVLFVCITITLAAIVRVICMRSKRERFCGVDRTVANSLLDLGNIRKLKRTRQNCNRSSQNSKECASKPDCEFYPSEVERRDNVVVPLRAHLQRIIAEKSTRRERRREAKRERREAKRKRREAKR
jgi:hypothetical protein